MENKKLDVLIVEYKKTIDVSMDHGEFFSIPKNNASIWLLDIIKNPSNYNVRTEKA